MATDLQKASIWKRTAAWLFDGILLGILAVACGVLVSWLLGYDAHSAALESAYDRYEQQYGVVFDISLEEYEAMSPEGRTNYDLAYDALIADEVAMYAYNMMLSQTLVILSVSLVLAVAVIEWLIPLKLGNGQTLGKKIFGLALIRNDGVQMNNMQLFTRSMLGKCTVETMIPMLILLMIYWGTMGVAGTAVLFALFFGQLACVLFTRTNAAIHDLMAGTIVVDYASQTIFKSTEDLIAYQKKVAADRAARAPY